MKVYGTFILVTGLYGAGKTSLVSAALLSVEKLEYLKTTTTRLPRPEEIAHGSLEYDFVTRSEYEFRRRASQYWDHSEVGGYEYGADIDRINQKLAHGVSVICCVAPDMAVILEMRTLYATPPVLIWVDTPLAIANARLLASGDDSRAARVEHRLQSESVVEPIGNLEIDQANFIKMLTQYMDASRR